MGLFLLASKSVSGKAFYLDSLAPSFVGKIPASIPENNAYRANDFRMLPDAISAAI
jgi:hypothetical protein